MTSSISRFGAFYSDVSAQDHVALWNKTKQHSNDICERLGLRPDDLEVIEKNKISCLAENSKRKIGFLSVTVSGKEFSMVVCQTSGWRYGDKWVRLLQVICTNDASVNKTVGVGNASINCINDEWHTLLLSELQNDIAANLKKQISDTSAKNAMLWKQVQQRSDDICGLLDIGKKDLPQVRGCLISEESDSRNKSFHFTIEGKEFKFDINSTSGSNYGGGWECLIQAVCVNDASLNVRLGGGTTLINVIVQQWHDLFFHESNRHIFVDFKRRISEISKRNDWFWKQAVKHSDELCAVLNCSKPDIKALEGLLPAKILRTIPRAFSGEKGFFCTIEDKEFVLCVLDTCGVNCGDKWKQLLQVFCINDAALNECLGGGTTFVTVLAEPWHQALLDTLKTRVTERLEQALSALQVSKEQKTLSEGDC